MDAIKALSQRYPDIDDFVGAQVQETLLEILYYDGLDEIEITAWSWGVWDVDIAKVEEDWLDHADEGLAVRVGLAWLEESHLVNEVVEEEHVLGAQEIINDAGCCHGRCGLSNCRYVVQA